jgi:2-iminobutanoate/2-iminopropanoate deaminase
VKQPLRREIRTDDAARPSFSYSQGIVFQDLLFIAGQVPRDPTTGDVPATFIDQARLTLDNLSAVALAGGTSLANALKVNVFLEDLENIHDLEAIYGEYFSAPFPARTTVRAGLRGYLIEIDAIVAT